ncbi:MAG: hypothetical protein M3Z31_08815 [Pseudomonadota bacterium]|nr:hypothetical protein [Pseudomonadota bacterium]
MMITLNCDGLRVEAALVAEPDGTCCVTAEVFEGSHMIRGYYRKVQVEPEGYADAEREVAEDVARMCTEAE